MQESRSPESVLRPLELVVRGMSCDNCAAGISKALAAAAAVQDPEVSFALGEARLRFDPRTTSPERIVGVGVVLSAAIMWIGMGPERPVLSTIGGRDVFVGLLTAVVQFYVGWEFLTGTVRAARLRTTNMDTLVAIGSGTDVAIEATDVVLVRRDLSAVADAIVLSRRTLRTIHQNLFWAFAYNLAAIPLATGVFVPLFGTHARLSPGVAALAMALSSLFVVNNSARLARFDPRG